jgi:site-specific recombinase XerD
MTALGPTLQAFFTDRLIGQRRASQHTIAAYRDTFRLLLGYLHQVTGKPPHTLDFDDLDAMRISAFLDHLEHERGNGARTRNVRLAAVHSLFGFAALHHPEHAHLIQQVLAIPPKRVDQTEVTFLSLDQVDALLAAPDRSRWLGRRDHALLLLAIQTGLRVSELTSLANGDLQLGTAAHVRCRGKGRKQRCTPLANDVAATLRVWERERQGGPTDPLFPTSTGRPLTRDAVALVVARHTRTATLSCPSLAGKTVTPHVLRHTAAMRLLLAGVDTSTIALWLGHEQVQTTQIYVHADQTIKERALARTAPLGTRPGRYRPSDALLAFLEQLR